jgi:hypothetical protein
MVHRGWNTCGGGSKLRFERRLLNSPQRSATRRARFQKLQPRAIVCWTEARRFALARLLAFQS